MNLGITKEELQTRFKEYDENPNYIGTNELYNKIKKIGIKKALELYSTNSLFLEK
jgi:hypothetical protein